MKIFKCSILFFLLISSAVFSQKTFKVKKEAKVFIEPYTDTLYVGMENYLRIEGLEKAGNIIVSGSDGCLISHCGSKFSVYRVRVTKKTPITILIRHYGNQVFRKTINPLPVPASKVFIDKMTKDMKVLFEKYGC